MNKGFAHLLAYSVLSEGSHVIEPFVLGNDRDHFYFGTQTGQISGEVMQKVSPGYISGGNFNILRRYAKDPLFVRRSFIENSE